jgi:hypothetical protein
MSATLELSKLAELHAKTDQELIQVIDSDLERGLHSALMTEGAKSASDSDSAQPSHIRAETAYAEALKLLSMVDDHSERIRLEKKLRLLREALDQPSTPDESWALAAYSSR